MTSSTEVRPESGEAGEPRTRVLTGAGVERLSARSTLTPLATPELREGSWTRYGGDGVLGDSVTEQALGALADKALEAARAQGYSTGWAQGRRDAAADAVREESARVASALAEAERREHEHRAALAALARAAAGLEEAAAAVRAATLDRALDLAAELTAALLAHDVATSPAPGTDLARRVLAGLSSGAPMAGGAVTVHVSAGLVGEVSAALAAAGHPLTVVPAADLGPHDARVETDTTVLDLDLGAALDRVRAALAAPGAGADGDHGTAVA
ncbi:hypothetical protein [Nocardioides sp.]|uniref:hypothetical protein n=1 Tax=Nocardioides sp. TaxID=35761 RepID=UPI003516E290